MLRIFSWNIMLFKVCRENYEDNFILKFYTKIITSEIA